MCLKQREPCVGAEKPEQFFDKIEGFVNTSKSLENLSKNLDSTDDNNSEESASLDTLSLNDQKSASEKRSDYQNKELKYILVNFYIFMRFDQNLGIIY